jgi:hypothetical protein
MIFVVCAELDLVSIYSFCQTNFHSIFYVKKWSFIVGNLYFSSSPQAQFGKKTKVNRPESHYPELEAQELKDLLQNHSRIPSNKDN